MTSGLELPARRQLAGGAAGAFAARAGGAVLMLAFQVIVARRLGTLDAGRFYLVFVITSVLAVVGRYGADQLLHRAVAAARDDGSPLAAYRGALALSSRLLGLAAVGLLAAAGPLAELLGDPTLAGPLRVAALGVVPFGLVAVQGEAIKGRGRATSGAAVQSLVAPAVTLGLVALPVVDSLHGVVVAYVAGLLASAAVAELVWRRSLPAVPDAPPLGVRELLSASTPFFWTSTWALVLLWADVIWLGVAGRPGDVAAYFAADRWAQVASMALVAVNGVIGPHFARLWAVGAVGPLRHLLRSTTVVLAGGAVALFAVTTLLAEPLLRIFGDDFTAAVTPLRLLAMGQLVVLATGPVTVLLVMVGGERDQARAGALAAAALVGLLLPLVPAHGASGAAAAATVALIVNKLVIVAALRRRIGREIDRGDVPGRVLAVG